MSQSLAQAQSALIGQRGKHKPLAALFLFMAEISLLGFVYKYDLAGLIARPSDTSFCMQIVNSTVFCGTATRLPPIILLLIIILGYLLLLNPVQGTYAWFREKVVSCDQPNFWLGVSLVGYAFILIPYFLALTDISAGALSIAGSLLWLVGSVAFTVGLVLWLLPAGELYKLVNWKVAAGIAFLLTLPQLQATIGNTLWAETFLQNATTELVIRFLLFLGQPVIWDGGIRLGIENFVVLIGSPCAGLSGIAFSSAAMAGYILWMRSELHVGRALAMIPVIALLSWTLNALRIALLIMLGEHVSPTLAVDGFHSYAGWISFTILTGAMIFAVDRTPWFQAAGAVSRPTAPLSIWTDPTSAQILPFTVFLFTSLVVGALFEVATLGYPLRILLTSACLLVFWRCLPAGLNWKADPLALGAGILVAAIWLLGQPEAEGSLDDLVPGVTGGALVLWVIVRIFGTSVIVPIVEELFFRGYLLKRLNIGGSYGAGIALFLTSTFFAALHGNFVLALMAGMIFGGLVLRSGRVMDAIYAHAAANLLIAIFALFTNNWSVI